MSASGTLATALPSSIGSPSAPVSPITASVQFQEYLYNSTLYPYKSWEQLSACFVSVPVGSTVDSTRASCERLGGTPQGQGKVERYRNTTMTAVYGGGLYNTSAPWSENYYYCFVPTFGGIPGIQSAYGSDGRQTHFCNTWGGFGPDNKRTGPVDTRGGTAAATAGNGAVGRMDGARGLTLKGCAVAALVVAGLML